MNLLVVRHAIAEAHHPNEDDAVRALTSTGERKFREVVKGLRALGWKLDHVLTSPWTRAARTAELLRPISGRQAIATDLLAQSPRAELLAMLAEHAADKKPRHATAAVGHEPWLGELVSWLAFGDSRHGEGIAIKKGGVVWLEGTAVPGGMTIHAILPPKVLRTI
ncbi:MAG TPA: histidine phosphatase family protein [Kofleriaceae bacterium]